MASTYLTRTPSGAGTSNKIFTQSVWVKRSNTGHHAISGSGNSTGYQQVFLEFNASHALRFAQINGAGEDFTFEYVTNRLFRDFNAWYHIVCTVDSTNSTEADRVKIYVNGVRETSFSTTNHPSLNATFKWNDARVHSIGREGAWDTRYFNGSMSHFHNIDGTAYQASTFGQTNATTGEWSINTSPNVTYGTNGFFILKDGNIITDSSPNSNNFSLGAGALTKTEDNPSNVFATLNPLIPMRGTPTYQTGNTYFRSTESDWDSALSTIGATSGKYYFEAKWGGQDNLIIGCVDVDKDPSFLSAQGTYGYLGYKGMGYFGETSSPRVLRDNSDAYTGLTTFASGDIIGCAIDLDNQEMFVHRNGTYTNSGNPSTRANPYAFSTSINQGNHVLMGVSSRSGYGVEVNFGNGYFSSTAVSSAGTNASNNGIFEYDVPSGYTALSTKGLNL